jgi:ribosomal protein L7/L12
VNGTDPDVIRRIAALEAKVDHILNHLPGDVPVPAPDAGSQVSPEVLALARAGETIPAIKLYREQTGVDLVVAKDVVEKLT